MRSPARALWREVALSVPVLLLVVSSAGAKPSAPQTPIRPQREFSSVIDGRVGGVVQGGNWNLVVPAGAFNGTTRISLVETFGGFPTVDLHMDDAALNQFAVPVVLSFHFGLMSAGRGKSIYWWNESQELWVELPTDALGRGALIQTALDHFSTYSVQPRGGKAGW